MSFWTKINFFFYVLCTKKSVAALLSPLSQMLNQTKLVLFMNGKPVRDLTCCLRHFMQWQVGIHGVSDNTCSSTIYAVICFVELSQLTGKPVIYWSISLALMCISSSLWLSSAMVMEEVKKKKVKVAVQYYQNTPLQTMLASLTYNALNCINFCVKF